MLKKMTYLAVTAAMLAVSSVSFAQPNRGGDLPKEKPTFKASIMRTAS